MLKGIILVILLLGLAAGGYWVYWQRYPVESPRGKIKEISLPLTKYDFDSLRKRGGIASKIVMGGDLPGVEVRRKEEINFESKQFYFESEGKKIMGMINIPAVPMSHKMPAVIMIRGYADKEGYYTGSGSWRMADKLAGAGFVTVSLDFLGFGGSDQESLDMLEARFEKVPAVMDLVESVKNLDFVDENKIGIWAHSNGGQIALSVLETTSGYYPTVLWAPMTNPFPQSVLETASDLDDGGKLVIGAIEEFERSYDSRRYAFENYYDWIAAPVVIHQGTADYWCKLEWQRQVEKELKKKGGEVWVYTWPGDDHNLSANWEEIVRMDIEFYKRRLN